MSLFDVSSLTVAGAIALYNDMVATREDDSLAVTNQALRELSGVNGLLAGDWIKAHANEVVSHNSKYEMHTSNNSKPLAAAMSRGSLI
jgi:hypothetical protein